ncbi:hypothetical protein B4065_2262 [Caldibacillus thermoamylovorans]|nr:hypothetical protein [Caldibacillus thermoamylovorans]KIO66718.1 hypothetical protein B4065_2262 [Caldibacillus thermoamylovorans]
MTIEAVILQVDHFFIFAQEIEIPQLGKGGRINVTDERFVLVAKK